MPTYILRKLDPVLWEAVKAKAAAEPIGLKALFARWMRDYVTPKA